MKKQRVRDVFKQRMNELFKVGILMTAAGIFIAFIGFSMSGWNYKAYDEGNTHAWYRTVTIFSE
ncbi:hypothetical protein [Enterococcus phoeniculicola]|jgi:hypothetical protein|uniref:Uncharacterized protein n=1 Tax=Enterococcus phoeniculicola ATCC BAA-412 TaxID=1158610 RepID=R3TMS4_9ENTE|nr:hypothetical protein [Enterococcus phoeniculicola]EOL42348.1 hypothetical protein UC3_02700 [Enterococcus phoeniculicola ATCC BAA-412]EOT79373.1 hypothetical protein I589_00881 [Enterococcus phoeniculicola ATCC BAA-412]